MKTIETFDTISKAGWPDGPWKTEPDRIQWRDEATGLPCLIIRNSFGVLCGYVGVSKNHPLFEKEYDDADVEVHGGLTFSGHCSPNKEGVCHIVEDGEDDNVWWLGFDCAHYMDYVPGMPAILWLVGRRAGLGNSEYRDIPYVKAECQSLAQQLIKDYDGRRNPQRL